MECLHRALQEMPSPVTDGNFLIDWVSKFSAHPQSQIVANAWHNVNNNVFFPEKLKWQV